GRKPKEIHVGCERAAGNDASQEPDIGTAYDAAPWHRALFWPPEPGRPADDEPSLRFVDGRMLRWVVPKPTVEAHGPRNAEHAEEQKCPAPAAPLDRVSCDHRRHRSANQGGGIDQPLGRTAAVRRKPASHDAGGVWQRARFA